MAFKSEIHVAELASIKTGHTEGDIYYILDNGMLGDLPCKPGTFVKWHNGAWQIQPDEHYALASAVDGEIAQAIDNLLDDGSTSETVVVAVPSSQSNDYIVGNYYEVQGKVAKLRTKTDGDNVTQLTFDTVSGVLAAINGSTGKIAVFEVSPGEGKPYPTYGAINSEVLAGKIVVLRRVNYDGRSDSPADYYYIVNYSSAPNYHSYSFSNGSSIQTVTSNNEWTTTNVKFGMAFGGNKTEADLISGELGNMLVVDGVNTLTTIALTTVNALTISCSTDVPNFALEIDNTGNANDVTVSVQNRNAALKPSTAGGTTVGAGKYVQLTCVGNCWTLAEFAMPNP